MPETAICPSWRRAAVFNSICDSKKISCTNTSKKVQQQRVKNHCCPTCFYTMLITGHNLNFCVILWKFPFCYSYKILLNLSNFQQPHNGGKKKKKHSSLKPSFYSIEYIPFPSSFGKPVWNFTYYFSLLSVAVQHKNVHCSNFLQLLIPFTFALLLFSLVIWCWLKAYDWTGVI